MRETWQPFSTERDAQAHEPCCCIPLSFLQEKEEHIHAQETLPISPVFFPVLQEAVAGFFPRSTPFSLFLLHIAQFKHIQMPPASSVICQRVSYHASASLQEQILLTIRRALRVGDQVLADEQGTGAALLFPQVDQEGMGQIAERIVRSINLLQAETVVPPLQYETEIVTGFASYPQPADSWERLLSCVGQLQERIIFRPAVVPRRERVRGRIRRPSELTRGLHAREMRQQEALTNGIPFMQIPSRLPTRLKQLIPYALALKLRCAPVGRNHNQLTVAMANPMDEQALFHLRKATGMTIFPVSCEILALDTLLASGW